MTYKNSNYAKLLKDPRWQKKRLEILNHADFHCERCGDGESTLHVHHKIYFKGRDPWEYENNHLCCLCENCHKEMHLTDHKDSLDELVSMLDFDGPTSRHSAAVIISVFFGLRSSIIKPSTDSGIADIIVSDSRFDSLINLWSEIKADAQKEEYKNRIEGGYCG